MSRYLVVPSFDGPSDTRSRDGSQRSAGSHSRHLSQGGPSHGGPSQARGSHVPASHHGGSRAGGSSRPPSNVGTGSGPVGYPAALGYDPARLGQDSEETPETMHRKNIGKRVDLPAEAYVQVWPNSAIIYMPKSHANLIFSLSLESPLLSDPASAMVESQSISVLTNSASVGFQTLMSINMT